LLSGQKPKQRATAPKIAATDTSTNAAVPSESSKAPATSLARPTGISTLADWTANDDIDDGNYLFGSEKRQRGGRKKRKKNREASNVPQDWDDIYDPSRPNNFEEYKHSDEKIREVTEWKERLYEHRRIRGDSDEREMDRMNSHKSAYDLLQIETWTNLGRPLCTTTKLHFCSSA
jgi:splicing factor 45